MRLPPRFLTAGQPRRLARVGLANAAFWPGASLALDFTTGQGRNGLGYGAQSITSLSGWSFSRTGTEYEANSSGSLVSFASGVPAITDLGLQVWEARTNLVLQSNTLNNASWTNNANISFGTPGTFIDGTSTFALLTATSTNACRAEVGPITVASGATYTLSAYFKAGSANGFIRWKTATTQAQFKLNLSSGATTAGPSNSGNAATVTLTQVSTGIWRATLTVAADATSVAVAVGIWDGTADQFGYPGTTSGTTVYAGGVQLEAAAFPGPYIPTTSSSATRGAASASVTLNSVLWPSAGTLFMETLNVPTNTQSSVERTLFTAVADGSNYHHCAYRAAGFNNFTTQTKVAGASAFSPIDAGVPTYTHDKIAYSWGPTGGAMVANGVVATTSSTNLSGIAPTTLYVGANIGILQLDAQAKRLIIYGSQMTTAQMQALTT
jgi:hypothetical protein